MKIAGRNYVPGQDRNDGNLVAHLYKGTFDRVGDPMCVLGWNRCNGMSFSIFRNNIPKAGICRVCIRRAKAKLRPVQSRERKTTWL